MWFQGIIFSEICSCMPMLCYAMLCYAMLCYAMLCYAMLCYAMLCYAMLCYAMLCYDVTMGLLSEGVQGQRKFFGTNISTRCFQESKG